jgi:hypothetical protein
MLVANYQWPTAWLEVLTDVELRGGAEKLTDGQILEHCGELSWMQKVDMLVGLIKDLDALATAAHWELKRLARLRDDRRALYCRLKKFMLETMKRDGITRFGTGTSTLEIRDRPTPRVEVVPGLDIPPEWRREAAAPIDAPIDESKILAAYFCGDPLPPCFQVVYDRYLWVR